MPALPAGNLGGTTSSSPSTKNKTNTTTIKPPNGPVTTGLPDKSTQEDINEKIRALSDRLGTYGPSESTSTNTSVKEVTTTNLPLPSTNVYSTSSLKDDSELQASRDALARAYAKSAENLKLQSEVTGKQAAEEAKRRLAYAGISAESGLYQKQLQQAELDNARSLLSNLGALEVEKSAKEAAQDYDIFKIDYQQALNEATENRKLEQTSWYNKGYNKEPLTDAEISYLQENRPDLYQAYLNGTTGKSTKLWELEQTMLSDVYRAKIAGLDPDSPTFQSDVNKLLNEFNNAVNEGYSGEESTVIENTVEEIPTITDRTRRHS